MSKSHKDAVSSNDLKKLGTNELVLHLVPTRAAPPLVCEANLFLHLSVEANLRSMV